LDILTRKPLKPRTKKLTKGKKAPKAKPKTKKIAEKPKLIKDGTMSRTAKVRIWLSFTTLLTQIIYIVVSVVDSFRREKRLSNDTMQNQKNEANKLARPINNRLKRLNSYFHYSFLKIDVTINLVYSFGIRSAINFLRL
jgi:hypothetical protein